MLMRINWQYGSYSFALLTEILVNLLFILLLHLLIMSNVKKKGGDIVESGRLHNKEDRNKNKQVT